MLRYIGVEYCRVFVDGLSFTVCWLSWQLSKGVYHGLGATVFNGGKTKTGG